MEISMIKEKVRERIKGRYFSVLGVVILYWLSLINPNVTIQEKDVVGITSLISLLFLCYRIFLGFHLEVSCCKCFSQDCTFKLRFDHYFNVIKILALRAICLVAWTLLFIIPGIIKYYQYTFLPFILAEQPHMKRADAFKLTKQMTKGNKFKLFLLELSYLWPLILINLIGIMVMVQDAFLAGVIIILIGILFSIGIHPYLMLAIGQAYNDLKPTPIDIDPEEEDLTLDLTK